MNPPGNIQLRAKISKHESYGNELADKMPVFDEIL